MAMRLTRRSLVGSVPLIGGAAVIGRPSSAIAAPAVMQAGDKVTVTFWHTWGSGTGAEAMAELVAGFHEANTDVEIVPVPFDGYEAIAASLVSGLQTGDVPDAVIFSENWWFQFYMAEALVDLNTLIRPETNVDDYVQSLFVEYQRNGGQWAIPFARSTPLLYYNNELLEKAGFTGDVFAAWSTLQEQGEDLIAAAGTDTALDIGGGTGNYTWYLQGTVWGYGGAYSDDDFTLKFLDEGTLNATHAIKDLVDRGIVGTVTDQNINFYNQATIAIFNSTGSLGGVRENVEFDFVTAFLPEGDQGFGCNTGGSGIALLNTSAPEVQEAGFRWIEYATSPESTTLWAKATGYMPVRVSARESADMQAYFEEEPNARTAVDQLELTNPVDYILIAVPNGEQLIGQGWEDILINGTAPEDGWSNTTGVFEVELEPVIERIAELEG